MDTTLGWQQVVEDLAGDNKEIREKLREIARWFPSMAMMRNHALGLSKVMRDNNKARVFPTGYGIPPPLSCFGQCGRCSLPQPEAALKVVDVSLLQDDATASGSYTPRIEDGGRHRRRPRQPHARQHHLLGPQESGGHLPL
ncbi:hypothetical protein ZWY2020_040947 [Hordeum vulgare]|nr:hypothetical protein ZWY2020_040947 [Hordeum vulgare]